MVLSSPSKPIHRLTYVRDPMKFLSFRSNTSVVISSLWLANSSSLVRSTWRSRRKRQSGKTLTPQKTLGSKCGHRSSSHPSASPTRPLTAIESDCGQRASLFLWEDCKPKRLSSSIFRKGRQVDLGSIPKSTTRLTRLDLFSYCGIHWCLFSLVNRSIPLLHRPTLQRWCIRWRSRNSGST
jgi:hypothetical protein